MRCGRRPSPFRTLSNWPRLKRRGLLLRACRTRIDTEVKRARLGSATRTSSTGALHRTRAGQVQGFRALGRDALASPSPRANCDSWRGGDRVKRREFVSLLAASLLFPILSANSQPNRQQRLKRVDHAVAKAFQDVKNCVAQELEYGSYPSRLDDALRVILVQNCRRQYDAFFQTCVASGQEAEVCLGFVQSWTASQFKERFYR